jgi:2-desacetyl-2-hydroxyethyl bacteriochlorophyllide A dehydrogenase
MNALVYHGPKDMRWEDAAAPTPRDDEVVVEVKAVGICGSDLHGYLGVTGRRIPPMIMGHEAAGIVSAAGKAVSELREGDRVCLQPINFCGSCKYCRAGQENICPVKTLIGVLSTNGAMADYVTNKADNTYKISDSLGFVEASMVEPFSVANNALRNSSSVKGRTVLIIGLGTIGLCLLQLLKREGPGRVIAIDLAENRLEAASAGGADVLVNPKQEDAAEAVRAACGGAGAELIFEAVGEAATVSLSIEAAASKAEIIWIGNSKPLGEIPIQKVVTDELSITGTYGFTRAVFEDTLSIMESGALDISGIVTLRADMKHGEEVFNRMLDEPQRQIKAVLVRDSDAVSDV